MGLSMIERGEKGKWIIETVEQGQVGEYTCHVLDSKNKAHIVYFDHLNGDLKHAEHGTDGWNIERVDQDGTVGQYVSITRDEGGRLYTSYRDQGKNQLKMAVFDGSRWTFEVVDREPFASLDTSICVDSSGKIHISYFNFSMGCLKLATKDRDRWIIEVVDGGQKASSSVGGFSSARLDARGRVHISYIDSGNGLLKYAVKEHDTWIIEVADDSEFVGNFTSLALDKEGNPYISYTVDDSPNKPDLWLARKAEGKWTTELVESERITGNYSSIVVDRTGNIHISYSSMRKLKLASSTQDHWDFEIVDPEGTVTYTSLSLDEHGMPHIAYCDKERGVKYAHKVSASQPAK